VLAFALAVILLASLTLPSAVALASNQASADSQIVIPPTSGGEIFFPTGPDVGAVVVPQSGPPLAPVGVNGAGTCSGPNLIANGDFEGGFSGDGIGNSWTAFNDGGRASYGYFDDTWPQVVVNGFNAQLIQINTYNMGAADGNRFSGIFQVIDGLVPGATYELSMYGEMREEAAHSNVTACSGATRQRGLTRAWQISGTGASCPGTASIWSPPGARCCLSACNSRRRATEL
jgi:hypothetical protein